MHQEFKDYRELVDAGIASPQSLSEFPDIDIDENVSRRIRKYSEDCS